MAFLAIGIGLAGCGSGSPSASSSAAHDHSHRSSSPSAAKISAIGAAAGNAAKSAEKAAVPPPGTSFVVALHAAVAGYPAPGQPSNMIVPASWYGYPSVLPVIATEPGWLYVRLAQRPNESTTWIKQSDVTLSTTPYVIEVDLATMHLTVTDAGKQIMDFPAGIGATRRSDADGELLPDHEGAAAELRLRRVRPGHVGPLEHHHRLGGLGRRHHRHPRPDHLGRRRPDRHDRGGDLPRLRAAARQRP